MKRIRWTLILFLLLQAGSSLAASLEARLVSADNQAGSSSPQLIQHMPMLTRNLPYKRFLQFDQKKVALNKQSTIKLNPNFEITCTTVGPNLYTIKIKRGGKIITNTKVQLKPKHPFIVGGFQEGNKRLLIILTITP